MRNTILILLALISVSCSQNNRRDHSQGEDQGVAYNFDWLIGSWIRSNDEEGIITHEHWLKNSDTEYTGLGCSLQDSDTIFKENLRLILTEGDWNLEVTGVNENPTLFLLINRTVNSFVCENEYNEFPKNIEYSLDDSILLAKISDGDTEILFSFEKLVLE